MSKLAALLNEYENSHKNPINIAIHWVAEPLAIFALLALAASVTLPVGSLLWPFLIILLAYFARLSARIAFAFLPIVAVFVWIIYGLEHMLTIPTYAWAAPFFVFCWVALLVGHKIEGRIPSVFQNPNLIVVGPAWLMRRIFRRLNLRDP